jgi:uncharacterized membrane protein YfcA
MLDSASALLLTGILVGIIGTLIGAGGGFILVPILLFTHPEFSPEILTAISMAIVALNAISGTYAYAREKRIDYKAGIQFSWATIPGSILGTLVTRQISLFVFNLIFGIILVALGIYLFFRKTDTVQVIQQAAGGKGWRHHQLTDRSGHHYEYAYNQHIGIAISLLVGFISPILGIGGGIIHVPVIVHWLQFPVHVATATSHFILAIMASITVLVHLVSGNYSDPAIQHMILFLGIGVIPGAQIGALLSHRIRARVIIQVLAITLSLVGIRIILQSVLRG